MEEFDYGSIIKTLCQTITILEEKDIIKEKYNNQIKENIKKDIQISELIKENIKKDKQISELIKKYNEILFIHKYYS